MVVLLGFADEKINKHDPVDWSTNKVGGLPNWVDNMDIQSYPRCISCSTYLYHLVQVYCPLQKSSYHRTLNIFGCTNKQCWNKYESIVVIRSQILEKTPVKEQKIVNNDDWGVSDWCSGNNDDWGISNGHVYEDSQTVTVKEEPMEMKNIITQIDDLTVKESNGCTEGLPHFTGYHVFVQEECDADSLQSKDYEIKLYQDYVSREGDIASTHESLDSKCKQNNAEKYEKTRLKHGDDAFHRFKKRISSHPEQLLRYEWGGKPLLLSNRSQLYPSISTIPNCSYCQSPRVFELQLMPGLLNCLHEDINNAVTSQNGTNGTTDTHDDTGHALYIPEDETIRIEFGCIYVFSCSKACWEGNTTRLEYAVLQPDPDVDVLK